jgi:hypothetical protein
MNNLAEDPDYAGVTDEMAGILEKWMAAQGDEDRATELKISPRD